MRIPQKQQSIQRYNSLKDTLRQASQKPANKAVFKQDGDRIQLTENVSLSFGGETLTVKKGSAFDEDIKTRDKISTELKGEGYNTQVDTFEHYSEPRGWWIFKRDQEMLKVGMGDRVISENGASSGFNTSTFEV